ncbi:MAG: YheU family protein [Pseudomonadota bacterium]
MPGEAFLTPVFNRSVPLTEFVEVPLKYLQSRLLQALLEEYASRDGTDYGETEVPLATKVDQLRTLLERRELVILYETSGEHWDIVPLERAQELLQS